MTPRAAVAIAAAAVCGALSAACDRPASAPDAGLGIAVPALAPAAAVAAPPGDVDPRASLALVREIAEARHGDQDTIDDRYARVRARWIGRRFRWEMAYSRALCRSPEWCAVTVFDRLRTPGAPNQGWLPLLHMSPPEHARLLAACPGATTCGAVFEGTLRTFSLSSVEPTSLVLDDVRLVRSLPAVPAFGAADVPRP